MNIKMGAACSGKANNPAALDRPKDQINLTGKGGKNVTFATPLEQHAPADLGSPRKELKEPLTKAPEPEVVEVAEVKIEVSAAPVESRDPPSRRSSSSSSRSDESERKRDAQKKAEEEEAER